MGEFTTYFLGTEKEIDNLYHDTDHDAKNKHSWAAVAELAGAYILYSSFPLTGIYLAADGLVRIIRGWGSKNPKPGLIGLAREHVSLEKIL
jgi:hypothetical protein